MCDLIARASNVVNCFLLLTLAFGYLIVVVDVSAESIGKSNKTSGVTISATLQCSVAKKAITGAVICMLMLRNEGPQKIWVRKPDLGPNVELFYLQERDTVWQSVVPPGSFLLPPLVVIDPGQIEKISFTVELLPGKYKLFCRYRSHKDSEVTWGGQVDSDVVILKVP